MCRRSLAFLDTPLFYPTGLLKYYDRVCNLFQAVNRVGLVSTTSSNGIMVDSSPPVLGHVYDVIDDGQTKDADYTVSI